MSLASFAYWLDETPASLAIKDSALAIPLAQSVHILAVAFVFSGSVLLALRSYNFAGSEWTLSAWGGELSGRLWIALGLLLASGSLLVLAEPVRELVNPAFQFKLLLLIPTVGLAIWLSRRQSQEQLAPFAGSTRAASLLLLVAWIAIISAGRWIAYI